MARHPSFRSNTKSAALSLAHLFELWLFRQLVPLGGHQDFIRQNGFKNDLLAKVVNLDDWIDIGSGDFDTKEALVKLRQLHSNAERKYRHAKAPACLAQNVVRLGKLVGLCVT